MNMAANGGSQYNALPRRREYKGRLMDLQNKVIVITGAARGLGAAMAKRFASKGSKLALVDLKSDDIAATVSACKPSGAEIRTYGANVANEPEVVALFEKIVADFGRLDGLCHKAGNSLNTLLYKFKCFPFQH